MTDLLKVSQERRFSLHHSLLGAARMALKNAEAKEPGWAYNYLICITMSALALEALANAFGEKLVSKWKYFDATNPVGKLLLVAEAVGLNADLSKKPWSNAVWLYKLRNKITHAKPNVVQEDTIMSREDYDKRIRGPKSALEKQFTLGNARKAYETVDEIKHLLSDRIDPHEQFGLRSDAWEGSAKSIDNR